MKTRRLAQALVLLALGQLFIYVTRDSSIHWTPILGLSILFIKLVGDALSKWVFKIPGCDWIYLRDYIFDELGHTLFTMFLAWFALYNFIPYLKPSLYFDGWTNNPPEIFHMIMTSSLPQVALYMFMQQRTMYRGEKAEKHMKAKL